MGIKYESLTWIDYESLTWDEYESLPFNLWHWHYLTFVIDSDGTRHAYFDGEEKVLDGDIVGVLSNPKTSDTLKIGNGLSAFDGVIDDVRISKNALSPGYVKFAYYNTNPQIYDSTNEIQFEDEERGCVASGGVVVGGYVDPIVKIEIEQEFGWSIDAYYVISQEFAWNVQPIEQHWYQINGDTIELTPFLSIGSIYQGFHGRQYQMILAGTSIADICKKLKENIIVRPIKWKVGSIKRYSCPIYSEENESECDDLISYRWIEVPECFELGLTTDEIVKIGLKTYYFEVHRYNATGSIYVGGTTSIAPQSFVALGGVSVGGGADVTSDHYSYNSVGIINVGGDVLITSSVWQYTSIGEIEINGSADVISPSWHYHSSGEIIVDGIADVVWKLIYSYASVGGLFSGGVADVEESDLHFIYDASGDILIYGNAEVASDRLYLAIGGVLIDGTSDVISPSYSYFGSGDIVLASLYLVGRKYVVE